MKLAVIVSAVCLLVCAALSKAELPPEMMEKLTESAEKCQKETGAPQDDIDMLMKHEVPASHEGQCFMACMNKEFGVFTADNKIDVDKTKQLIAPLKEKDADKYEKVMKIVDACMTVTSDGDECDLAKKMMECCKKEAEAMGFTDSVLMK